MWRLTYITTYVEQVYASISLTAKSTNVLSWLQNTNYLAISSLKTWHVIDCPEQRDKIRHAWNGKVVFFSIPIDFCIEFWNSTFPQILEFTEVIFNHFGASFLIGKPWMRSCFRYKVVQVFLPNVSWPLQRILFLPKSSAGVNLHWV